MMKMGKDENRKFLSDYLRKFLIMFFCLAMIALLYFTRMTWGGYRSTVGGKDSIYMAPFQINISEDDIHTGEAKLQASGSENIVNLKNFTSPGASDFMSKAFFRTIKVHNSSSVSVRVNTSIGEKEDVYRWYLLTGEVQSKEDVENLLLSHDQSGKLLLPGEEIHFTLAVWAEMPEGGVTWEFLDRIQEQVDFQVKISVKQAIE